jgi:adenosyl cobinamide kinase/adenosyl cobinamide phosphate guanylyltransferase
VDDRVRMRLANVDTRWRSAVVVTTTTRRSLIEDDEGRQHSMLVDCVEKLLYMLLYAVTQL